MATTWCDLGAAVGGSDDLPPPAKATCGAAFEVACALANKTPDLSDYVCYMASLMSYLRSKHNDLFKTILPLLNANPFIAFYTILMPFSITESNRLISEKIIGEWWQQNKASLKSPNSADSAKAYLDMFNVDLKALYEESGIQMKAAQQAIEKFRRKIKSSAPETAPASVIAVYDEMTSAGNGMLCGVPIIPARTVQALQPDQYKWIQTVSFIIAAKFEAMGPMAKKEPITKILETIYCSFPGNEYGRELTFLDPTWWSLVVTRLDLAPLLVFVLHSGFLLAAMPLEGLQAPKCNLNSNPLGIAWDTHALAAQQLKGVSGGY